MIPIKNVYYMLTYAFQVLNEQGYKNVATEKFENIADLYAAILIKGITIQLKRGLGKDSITRTETLSYLHGRIDFSESVKSRVMRNRRLVCTYDEISVNSYMNRIIKTTLSLLLRTDISKSRKKEIRKLMLFFGDIDLLEIHSINWKLHFNRNNQTYLMLISICHLVVTGFLQSTSEGVTRLMDFMDEQSMYHLYEKFILEYYRKEFPRISANSSYIQWQLDNEMREMLPIMQTDVMLTYGDKTLIIDAKYYSKTMREQFGVRTLNSNNLYQIFTYVKNKHVELLNQSHLVSGMLLYAKTDESIYPDYEYQMSGNKISVKTLDLNCDFLTTKAQLNQIIADHFGEIK
ncbi:MAG: 5-methylcytosine-specific restriction endonuclease system specificity protein McrC [Chloroflexi bacterium]|nr:5-methylcytosine-specific restriction endonuclease system specificity protein McrC [Chloroflexota bacterium]